MREQTRELKTRKRRPVEPSARLAMTSIRRRTMGCIKKDEGDILSKIAEEEEEDEVTESKQTPLLNIDNHHRVSQGDALCNARKKKSRKSSPESTASLPSWSGHVGDDADATGPSSSLTPHPHPHKDLQQVAAPRRQWYSQGEKVLVRVPELSEEVSFYNAKVVGVDDQASPPVYSLEIIDDGLGCQYYGSSLTVRSTPDKMFVFLLKQEPVWLRLMTTASSSGIGGGGGGGGEGKEKDVITSYERALILRVDMNPDKPLVFVKWPDGSTRSKIYPGVFGTSFECIEQVNGLGESSRRTLECLQLRAAGGVGGGETSTDAAVKLSEPSGELMDDEGSRHTEVIEIL